jgi:hypothetical protein
LPDIADPRNEDAPTQSTPHYKSMCDVITEDFLPPRKKEKAGNIERTICCFLFLPSQKRSKRVAKVDERNHLSYFLFF